MLPRNLAVGIVASLALHVVLAAGIALLPPGNPPAAAGGDLVALRVLDARPEPATAPATSTAPAAVADPQDRRPAAPPRAARPRPRAPVPAPDDPETPEAETPEPAPQPAADSERPVPGDPVRTATPGDVAARADDGPANPGDGGGTGDGPAGSARDATAGADAAAGGDPRAGGARAGNDGGPVLAQRRRAYALDVRRSLESVGRYPATARRLGLAGEVVLRVRIDEAGRVANTSVDAPSRHPELDRAALASARRLDALSPPPGGAIDVVVPVVFTMRAR